MKGETRTLAGFRPAGNGHRPLSRPSLIAAATDRAAAALLRLQADDGHWCAELQGDTILESEFILLMAFLGRHREEKCLKAARYILTQELPGGGWSNYPGGPADLSVSVKAYFALKLTGIIDVEAPPLRRARDLIRGLGGAAGCNSFTKFYLALLGQFPYANCATVPPELVLLPRWFYVNLYAMSAWTRTIVVPLTIFSASKPCRELPPEQGIGELFLRPQHTPLWPHPPAKRLLSWTNFFLGVDWLLKKMEACPLFAPLRRRALRRAAAWMRAHFSDSDGVGAIFPPMIYTVISLKCLGVADDDPEMRWALKQLDDLMIEEGDTIRLQPCFSPVWDTALALNALGDVGVRGPVRQRAVERAARWLLAREARRRGDWSLTNPQLEPGGWFFEYRNGHYPDTDDTAMVLMALAKTGQANTAAGRGAAERGLRWLLGMQNKDGGWAAFDRDINRQVLTQVPFADHNAMLDPSCPDITARVLEALGHFGYTTDHPQVQRAVAWLTSVQQPGGGWGESCASYNDPRLAGQGTPTASQTGWALLALLAAGEADSEAVRRGIDWLLRHQRPDGTWEEEVFTGTGFPKVFYLKYHLYPLYFPLMALARYQAALGPRPAAISQAHQGNGRDAEFSYHTDEADG